MQPYKYIDFDSYIKDNCKGKDTPASCDLLYYDCHKKKVIFIENSLRKFVKKVSCSQDYQKTYFIAFSKILYDDSKKHIDTEYLKRLIEGKIRAKLGDQQERNGIFKFEFEDGSECECDFRFGECTEINNIMESILSAKNCNYNIKSKEDLY